ncbi:hypothetical protein JYJ95_23390 [Corallococcus exiguus]|uniref:hypothetical protein n=1 Tax=Corallococcus exiguus TaxID=83462 RepID=UPI001A8D140D|nr:hypothetical protein [Corallococcus exiguus]MBN8469456.1 hypothetical protein [Corallococcus exiguus]
MDSEKNEGVFDELVVDHWLHLEQLDEREWWMRVGDARLLVRVESSGDVRVDGERGCYAPILGITTQELSVPSHRKVEDESR